MKHKKKIILTNIIILTIISFCGIITYNQHFVDISGYTYEISDEQATIDDLPSSLKNALIAVEDSRFYTHNGIDYIAIARASLMNIIEKDVSQGASTITQQLARTLFLPDISTEHTKKDSIDRKIKEIIIAKQLEKQFSKDTLLTMYFNETYFGAGNYGVKDACTFYFDKSLPELTLAESALLAGLPQAPSAYAPNHDLPAAKTRQEHVLDRMIKEKYIKQEEANQALQEEIIIQER